MNLRLKIKAYYKSGNAVVYAIEGTKWDRECTAAYVSAPEYDLQEGVEYLMENGWIKTEKDKYEKN